MSDPTSNYNEDWLKKWLRGEPHVSLGGETDPYLKRWYILPRNTFFNVYLHKFCKSDEDRALHDHPWDFWSFILKGSYTEETATGPQRRRRFSLAHRKAEHAHRVVLDPDMVDVQDGDTGRWYSNQYGEIPVWTLFVTTAKRREWGFLCRQKWVHWTEFTSGPKGEESIGCGEWA